MSIEVDGDYVTGEFRIRRSQLRKWKRRIGVALLVLGAGLTAWLNL